jgi:WD40 repeat protein
MAARYGRGRRHRATVTDVRWHPSRDQLCATSYGGVTILDPAEAKPVKQLAWQGSSLCARWSPDARYIATGEQDASVHFWIVASGKDLQMTGYPTKIRELAWDRQGRFLATGGGPEVAVWDCGGRGPAGSDPIILPGHEQRVSALAFQHKGPRLVSGGGEGRLVLWQPGAPNPLVGATLLSAAVTATQWSADDRDILVSLKDGAVFSVGLP